MKKIKITELPLYNSLEGLYTIGTDKDNRSVRVELSFIVQAFKEVVAEAKAAAEAAQSVADDTSAAISGKVDKVEGKGLSANDFTDALKAKLEGLSNYDDTEVRALITAVSGRLDTILGDGASTAIDTFNEIEAFLAGITDTQTLTGLLQEQKQTITTETDNKLANKVDKVSGKGLSTNDYTNDEKAKLGALPTKTELDSSLAAKLDKSKWDEEHEQFTIKGYFLGKRGNVNVSSSENTGVTPLLPLRKTYPIVLKNVLARGNAVAVGFYDAAGLFISYPEGIEDLNGDFTIQPSDFPENAVFFRVCTERTGSSYSNGPTQESREGAVSEAIQAAMTAAVDETLIAEATAAGAVFNRTSGYFELNTLTDITAEQMRKIMAAGARQSSTLPWAYVSSTIRTHLPRVGIGQAANAVSTFRSCPFLEIVKMPNMILQGDVFFDCKQLRSVNWKGISIYDLNNTANANFQGCSKLVELRGALRGNFDFNIADSPLLNLASFQYMVDHAYNKSAITVTVHPTVYAKLTDEQADIMALLPENLLTGPFGLLVNVDAIDNGVEPTAPGFYFQIGVSPRLLGSSGGNLTLSCDVEGLQEGESVALLIGSSTESRPTWTISTNGRAVFSFNFDSHFKINNSNALLIYDAGNTYTGQGLKLTNFKLSYGEHDALPYTAPLSSITDDATREKAEWLSLMQIAEAKNINFVTTE